MQLYNTQITTSPFIYWLSGLFQGRLTISKRLEILSKTVKTEIKTAIPSKPGREIEKQLYIAIDHPLDPEREKKIATSIRVIVSRLKPFAKEFRPLLEEIGLAKEND